MSEASTKNIPPDKLVRVTFMPEGKTVEFEFGTLPYDHHGKPMSFLDVAENFGIFLDHACGGVCACTTCHLWIKDQTGISEADDDEIDRMDMAADQQLEFAPRLPGCHHQTRQLRRRDSQVEPQLHLGRQAAGLGRRKVGRRHACRAKFYGLTPKRSAFNCRKSFLTSTLLRSIY